MSTLLRPSGPLPPGIYWVRRLVALLVVLAVLLILWWVISAIGGGGGTSNAGNSTSKPPSSPHTLDVSALLHRHVDEPLGELGLALGVAVSVEVRVRLDERVEVDELGTQAVRRPARSP